MSSRASEKGRPASCRAVGILVPVDVTKPQWTANAGTLARLKDPDKLRRPDILDIASSLLNMPGLELMRGAGSDVLGRASTSTSSKT